MDFRFQNNQVLCCSDIHRFSRHFVQTPPALGSCSTFIPSQSMSLFRSGRASIQKNQGLGRKGWCAAGIWPEVWFLLSCQLGAQKERQPFPFKGRFLFHNLPTISLLQGLLRGTGAAKKPGWRSSALALRMSGGPAALVPLQPDSWSQSTNWKTISPQRTQKAQELLPSETKRQLVSSSRPQGPPALVCQRWSPLNHNFTPKCSQPLLSFSLGLASPKPVSLEDSFNISFTITFLKNLYTMEYYSAI